MKSPISSYAVASRCCLPLIASAIIVCPLHAATLTGYWNFDNAANIGQATVGNNLSIIGTAPTHSVTRADDSATSLAGVITTTGGTANYLIATHGIAPSPSFVINYTFVMDIFSPVGSRSAWRSIFQTNQANTNDADYFIRNSNDTLGINALTYSPFAINEAKWTRLAITVDLNLAGGDVKTYLDGALLYTHTANPTTTGTYALDPTVLFFADNDNENAPLNVGALAVFSGTMTSSEVSALGSVGTAIPETSSTLLGGLGVLALLRRRRA